IAEHDVEATPLEEFECLVAPTDKAGVISAHLEHARATFAERAIVVDDQYLDRFSHLRRNVERIAFGGRRGPPYIVVRVNVRERSSSHSVLLRSESGTGWWCGQSVVGLRLVIGRAV